MPTGYTAKLMDEGQTFEEFIMQCTRGMGVCVTMRYDSWDTPIPERFEPSDYHPKRLEEARQLHTKLTTMSRPEKIAFGETEKAQEIQYYQNHLREYEEQNVRLEAMRIAVAEWTPPTWEHEGLKEFMLDQLKISYNDPSYIHDSLVKARAKAPMQYWLEALEKAQHDIDYHTEEWQKEQKRTEDRNRYLRKLRESLNAAPDAAKE